MCPTSKGEGDETETEVWLQLTLLLVCRRGNWLTVPKGWLCYLAPEIIRNLGIHTQDPAELPFSFSTDVYAFG